MTHDRRGHWESVYSTKAETEVSWFQDSAEPSLELIRLTGASTAGAVIDIGGGASRLVDALLDAGYADVSVLDLSAAALEAARSRLGGRSSDVDWIVADVTTWSPPRQYDVWHDRAALHFLTAQADRQAYVAGLAKALKTGGHAILGTFAPDGPEKCSGLPVMRHDAESLAVMLGPDYRQVDTRRHDHVTPWGSVQRFQFSSFQKVV